MHFVNENDMLVDDRQVVPGRQKGGKLKYGTGREGLNAGRAVPLGSNNSNGRGWTFDGYLS